MKRSQLKSILSLILIGSALSACGGRAPGMGVETPLTDTPATAPATDVPAADPNAYVPAPDTGYTQPVATNPVAMDPNLAAPMQMTPAGSFKVDQGNIVYGWRARGIAVSSGTIYVAAADNDGLAKNGTVIKMDSTSGKNWKDIGTSILGLSSKLSSTIQGVAIAGGNLYAIDSTEGMFSVRTSGGEVKPLKGTGGTDIAGSNYGIFVAANGALERGDMTGSSRAPMMPPIVAMNGIGSDSRGNIFFINGPRVGVIDLNGMPRDVIMAGTLNPIDVAADGRNGDLYVLEGPEVKRFSMQGQLVGKFTHGASQAVSIALDEMGNVYVSDYGTSSSDSKILKFSPPGAGMPGAVPGAMPGAYPQAGYGQPAYGGAYPQTGYGQPAYGSGYPQTGYTGYSAQQSTGAYPQATGAYPAATGAYPQATGAYPAATGAYPAATGGYGAYSAPQSTPTRRY